MYAKAAARGARSHARTLDAKLHHTDSHHSLMNLELKKKTKKMNWCAEGEENGLKKKMTKGCNCMGACSVLKTRNKYAKRPNNFKGNSLIQDPCIFSRY